MSDLMEVAVVGYANGAKEICEAPYACGIKEGTEVETDFGRGKVEKVNVICGNENVWLLLKNTMKVSKIRYVLRKLEYDEEENNAIPD